MAKIIKKYNRNGGAAMIIVVLFFVFISLTILVGIITPVVREFKVAGTTFSSRKAYFLAESGVEDAMYRLKNNKQISATENLSIGTDTTTTTITTIGSSQKEIDSLGDSSSKQRKVSLLLDTGAGVSFNYGVLVGQGGIDMSGSSVINGNVYANGPITGDSSSSITGSAISANSPSLSADQSNGTGTPAYDVSFANASATQDVAQSFQLATSSPFNYIQLYIKKVGTPSNATVKILNDTSGHPGTTVYATGTLDASTVTTSYGWATVSFTSNPLLSTGTTYWIMVDAGSNSSKYYVIGANQSGYANGAGKIGQSPNTWNNTTPSGLDYYFSVYLGGVNGSISGTSQNNQLHIGTTSGTAQAHTVNYTNSTGLIYCQSGTGNNKSCTSQTDPIYQTFPVSDANISDWETTALAGGTYNGNYNAADGAKLGPKKIVGNLTVSGGATLTVTGSLWVTGNLSISGSGVVQLDPSYNTNDGVIVVDGTVDISGGGKAMGSGAAGSYIMILSNSSSSSAATVSGGAGALIVYAPKGTMTISGSGGLKEATAYRLILNGSASVTYESGLANNNFSSGPSGSWNVSSWKESQ